MLRYCFGLTPGHSSDHGVSDSLVGVMPAPLLVLVALLCSAYKVFHVACLFQGLFSAFMCDLLSIVSVVWSAVAAPSSSYVVWIIPGGCGACWHFCPSLFGMSQRCSTFDSLSPGLILTLSSGAHYLPVKLP